MVAITRVHQVPQKHVQGGVQPTLTKPLFIRHLAICGPSRSCSYKGGEETKKKGQNTFGEVQGVMLWTRHLGALPAFAFPESAVHKRT